MTQLRIGTYAGLFCALPVAVWLLTSIELTAGSSTAVSLAGREAAEALALLHGIIAIVVAPWLTRAGRWDGVAGGLLMLALVPLPLLTVTWLTGATSGGSLLGMPLAVVGLGASVYLATLGVFRMLPAGQGRAIAVLCLQAGGCAALWMARDLWLSWLVG